jgi:hypothetical protein
MVPKPAIQNFTLIGRNWPLDDEQKTQNLLIASAFEQT